MMIDIDWKNFFFGDENWEFLFEIALRTAIMYIIILTGLRLLGKRGVNQLSVFELVVIISLGSAAGDPMFYREIGLLMPVVIFSVVVGAYRLTTYTMAKSEKLDDLIEGKCTYLIKDGQCNTEEFEKEALALDEFFAVMRQKSITHLGQVETVILETSGALSIYFYPDEQVQDGLPILPALFEQKNKMLSPDKKYACAFCGKVVHSGNMAPLICSTCGRDEWVIAIGGCRIT
jgi:uncharacterized membrane protein YcaP (DUF421 family)